MPLDPRLSLGLQPWQIPSPDLAGTLTRAIQLRNLQSQDQIRQAQLQALEREQRETTALRDVIRQSQLGAGPSPGTLSQPSSLVQPGSPGVDQSPVASLPSLGRYQSEPGRPNVLNFPLNKLGPETAVGLDQGQGMAWSAYPPPSQAVTARPPVPATDQTVQTAPLVQAPGTVPAVSVAPGRPGLAPGTVPTLAEARTGWNDPALKDKLMLASPEKGLKLWNEMQDNKIKEEALKKQALEMAQKRLSTSMQMVQLAVDQPTWEAVIEPLAQLGLDPRLLPRQFSVENKERLMRAGLTMEQQFALLKEQEKAKAGQQRVGLEPIYGVDEKENQVIMQLTTTGEVLQSKLPPGVRLTPGTIRVDAGTEWEIRDARTGQLLQRIPKALQAAEQQKAAGRETGELEAKLPQRRRDAETAMGELEAKRQRAEGFIADAEKKIKEGWFVTGFWGNIAKGLGSPQAVDLAGVLNSIGANIGLEELTNLKAAGTSLGSVTQPEHQYLQGLLGTVQQAGSAEQLLKVLGDIRKELEASKKRRQQAFERDFPQTAGKTGTAGTAGTAGSAGAAPPAGAKTITRAQLQQLATESGDSLEDVERTFRAEQWTIR